MASSGLENLVPDLGQVNFGVYDYLGLLIFALCTVGYHTFYALWTRRHPLETVKGKIALYRRTWVKRILDRDEQMLAVQSLRNLLMTSQIMASSALLVIAVVLNYLLGLTGGAPEDARVSVKLLLLVACFGYAFFSFLLSTRYLNHFTILVGADRDLIGSVEPVDAVTFLSNLVNRSANRFTMGQRAFYYSLPVMAWLVDPRAFILFTVAVFLYLVFFLDFKRWKPPFPMRARLPAPEAPPPGGEGKPGAPAAPARGQGGPATGDRRGSS